MQLAQDAETDVFEEQVAVSYVAESREVLNCGCAFEGDTLQDNGCANGSSEDFSPLEFECEGGEKRVCVCVCVCVCLVGPCRGVNCRLFIRPRSALSFPTWLCGTGDQG